MIGRTILISLLGLAVGATFGPVGAGIGLAIGLGAAAIWMAHDGLPAAGPVGHERRIERVLCVPHASIAEVEMTRDKRSGLWLNVERCSICEPEDRILCDKCCLIVMNDTARKPGELAETPEESVTAPA